VTFLTDVPGVLQDGQTIVHLTRADSERLIAEGVIKGGMVVKLNAALDALAAGVKAAVITNLDGLLSDSGTKVTG
jgi:acetylglutamate kinase